MSKKEALLKTLFEIKDNNVTVKHAAEQLGITRQTVHKYLRLLNEEGIDSVRDNRVQNHRPLLLSEEEGKAIISVRLAYPHGSCSKIYRKLPDSIQNRVSRKTVYRFLKSRGLHCTIPKKKKAIRFEKALPNEMWQLDVSELMSIKGIGVISVVAIIDDHSRFCLAGKIVLSESSNEVIHVLIETLEQYGMPYSLLTDNHAVYVVLRDKKQRTRFSQGLEKLGIKHYKSAPRHPQSKGKVEAFFKFLQRDCFADKFFTSLYDVQKCLDEWVMEYNHCHRHSTTNELPCKRYTPSEKRVPSYQIQKAFECKVHRKVKKDGRVKYQKHWYQRPLAYNSTVIEIANNEQEIIFYCNDIPIKVISKNGAFTSSEEDRATQECDPSASRGACTKYCIPST